MPVRNETGSARPITRSTSLLRVVKSILQWGKDSGEQPDTPGKRKGTVDEAHEVEGGQRSNKRQRVGGSPVRESTRLGGAHRQQQQLQAHPPPTAVSGYLEPPNDFFGPTNTAGTSRQAGHIRAASLTASPSLPSNGAPRAFTAGPAHDARPLGRTQSMDPPNRYRPSFASSSKPLPLVRDVSMDDGSFNKEMSASPAYQPFRMRTSLTPAPSGQYFGPDPARHERNESEPPPLAQLVDRPMFVKAPSEAPMSRAASRPASTTLGALAEAQRTGKGLQRSHSSLRIGSDSSMQDLSEEAAPAPTRPVTQTEKMIRDLAVYKTPLLPTRLRGSAAIPDMFKPKAGHALVLMHDRESKPRLGTGDNHVASERAPDEGRGVKPYAGRGGMKKMLERRRQEEDEEKEKEKSVTIETDEDEVVETSRRARALDEKLVKELEKPLEPAPPEARPFIPGREQSSLRIGRQRTSRNHIQRPQAKTRGGRFSALYEDEDEDAMDDGSKPDLSKPKATVAPPPGFSFAKDTVPVSRGDDEGKEPPVKVLPFSLTKSTSSPSQPTASGQTSQISSKAAEKPAFAALPKGFTNDRDVPHPSPPITVAADSQAVFAPAPLTPLINTVPQIALIPPSPGNPGVLATAPKQPVAEQLDASLTGKGSSAVPNFFANSAALSKPSAQVTLPSNFSFGPPSSSNTPAAASAKDVSPFFNKPPEAKDNTAAPKSAFNLFGASSPTPQVSTHAGDEKNPTEASKVPPTPLFKAFGGTEAASAFSKPSGASTEPASSEPSKAPELAKDAPVASSFTFGQPTAKPAEPKPTTASPFPFGAPSQQAERPASTPSPLPFQFGAPAKPVEPTASSDSRPSTGDALKPPFSFGAPTTGTQPSQFGASSATPSPSAVEPAKSPFTFGQPVAQPAAAPSAPSASTAPPAIEAPKPTFGAFKFGQPPAPSAPEPAKSPFTFGNPATAPSTPTNDNKFTFGASAATPAPAGPLMFGAAASSTPAATRTVTPPKKEDSSEVMMDESPLRSTIETPSKPELPKLNGGFGGTFGTPAQNGSTPFGFTGGSSPNPFAEKTEAKSADKTGTPFSFGQPSTTGGFTFGKPAEASPAPTTGFSFNKASETSAAPNTGTFGFGQKAAEPTAASATTGSFPFSSPATPSTSTAPGFGGFGAPQIAPSNSFGQPASATSSAPSPNPFNQPAQPAGGFFGASTPTTATGTSNPFTFGSQPASPAAPSAVLPGQNGGGTFTFGPPTSATGGTPSPYTPSAALPPAGGPVFNMGAAPPPTPGVAGRQMKKLPNRRGGKR